jgi:hypothetical protein
MHPKETEQFTGAHYNQIESLHHCAHVFPHCGQTGYLSSMLAKQVYGNSHTSLSSLRIVACETRRLVQRPSDAKSSSETP